MGKGPSYSEDELRTAVGQAYSYTEVLRRLGMCPTGGGTQTVKKWIAAWGIPTDHFDPNVGRRAWGRSRRQALSEILIRGSAFSRGHLKKRLYEAGLKKPRCELCGQSEIWHGARMSLILDHINGVRDDHRLENLRVVCPNCAATLDTHCGRSLHERPCEDCGLDFKPRTSPQRYCSRECWWNSQRGRLRDPSPERRKVERPPYDVLITEIAERGYVAVGRKYGVSDNAVRKWMRRYRQEREATRPEAA